MRIHRAANLGLFLCAFVACGVAASGCTQESLNVHTATNPGANFEQYRTFSFGPAEGPPKGYQTSPQSAEVQRRIVPLIAADLTERGYTQAPAGAKADFFIMCGSGRRASAVHETSDITNAWLPDDEEADFVEGSLVIDAFDTSTGGRVWHGASQSQIDPGHIDDDLLQRSVAKLLQSFPSAAARAQ